MLASAQGTFLECYAPLTIRSGAGVVRVSMELNGEEYPMKKNVKKLRLNRDTIALLDSHLISTPKGGGAAAAIETSSTYTCDCPTGCSDEQACIGSDIGRA